MHMQFKGLQRARLRLKRPVSYLFTGLVLICCFQINTWNSAAQNLGVGLSWEKETTITRPVTKKRPQPVRIQAPLLTLRWQFLVAGANTAEQAISPKSREFIDGEFVRMAVQVNQKGYLYVINHTVKSDKTIEGPFLISRGKYSVNKNQQVILPLNSLSECPEANQKDGKCWWKIRPPAGREVVTIIFSRDEIEEWSQASPTTDLPVDETKIYELTREAPKTKSGIWTTAMQKQSKLEGLTGPYVTMVWNPNSANNELLVERIEFNHK